MVLSLIKVGVANLAAVVRARGAVHSVVVPKAGVRVQVHRAVKLAVRVKTAIKPRKFTMDSLLL
jgi:hypothetical protein